MEQLNKFKDFDPAKIAAKLKQVELKLLLLVNRFIVIYRQVM